ncbi:RDD family protein [Sphingosinicella sp.]|uniref:RDD family protein n=1 Tax=Sphingosinicella sp. TaxID=1917971 RepID=UPI004037E2E4
MAEFAAVNRTALGQERRHLVTPEGVDLSLSLADMGQRAGAFLLDWVIIIIALVALFFVCAALAGGLGDQAGGELALIVFLLGLFLARNFYFILMEMGPRAATFGKRAVGIRVVAKSGDRLTADRVIARNLTREIEAYLPLSFIIYNAGGEGSGWLGLAGMAWTGLFLFFPTFNRDRLRVGDLLAGTWVINAPKRKLTYELAAADAAEQADEFRFTDAQLDVYGVFELQTLEQVLRDSQPESIASVAATIRYKIGATLLGGDREFLVAYYQAARARMERGLLFGKRRENKFDRG